MNDIHEKAKYVAEQVGLNWELTYDKFGRPTAAMRNNLFNGTLNRDQIELAYAYLSCDWARFDIKNWEDALGRLKWVFYDSAKFMVDFNLVRAKIQ